MGAVIPIDSDRYRFTVRVAEQIRKTGYRFDRSWRDPGDQEDYKAAFYARCCTFAANDIADNPEAARVWRKHL